MPIAEFENREKAVLTLVIEPSGQTVELPHLARAGIRYALPNGVEDRSTTSVYEQRIEFWCSAESVELDIVHPTSFDRLLWELCVKGGWCGGVMNGQFVTVDDLLPQTGAVTAEEFAVLAVRADGWPVSEPIKPQHLRWIESRFIEHLGAPMVDVEVLKRNRAIPFGEKA